MDRNEAKKILMIVKSAYPNWKPDNITFTINLWATFLKKYEYKTVESALVSYIETDKTGFAPSIGQIIDKIYIPEDAKELNDMEAWALVSKALRNGYYGADEEFSKLPELVKEAVGTPSNLRNWAMSDNRSVETVIQSNFIKVYQQVKTKYRDKRRLSAGMFLEENEGEKNGLLED